MRFSKRIASIAGLPLATLVVLLGVPFFSAATQKTGVIETEMVALPDGTLAEAQKGVLVVRLAPRVANDAKREVLARHGLVETAWNQKANLCLVERDVVPEPSGASFGASTPRSPEALLAGLRQDRNIESALPNFVCRADEVPGHKHFDQQWNLQLTRFPEAWDIQEAVPSVVVAVLDSGVAYENNISLAGSYFAAPQLASVPFLEGYDFINRDGHPNDDFGHGTHIASIIAAGAADISGIAGASSGCSIMPVKVLDAEGKGTLFTLIDGIIFAAESGADVINMSLSFSNGLDPTLLRPLETALAFAASQNAVLVASSGNDGLPRVNPPASFNECIAVGAVARDGKRATYSNFGMALDVVAPGGEWPRKGHQANRTDSILGVGFSRKTPSSFGYWRGSGTSQATAHVSALAALLFSTGLQEALAVRNIIQNTASPVRGYSDPGLDYNAETGSGIIDARRALQEFPNIQVDPLARLPGYVSPTSPTGQPVPTDLMGLIIHYVLPDFYDGHLVLLQGRDGLYAVTERDLGVIDIYRASQLGIKDVLPVQQKVLGRMWAGGGVEGFLFPDFTFVTDIFGRAGGVMSFIDDVGHFRKVLDNNDGLLGLMDDNGFLMGIIEQNGGILGMLEQNGGMLALLEGNGGLVGWLDANGGILALMDSNGGIAEAWGL